MIKHIIILSVVGLVIIVATVLVAGWLYTPTPPIATTTALTADELYQQEVAEAIRTCGVYDKPQNERTSEIDGSIPLDDCIAENKSCQAIWGPHSVWSGMSQSTFDEAGKETLVPNCKCDKGYEWLNIDGTIGVTSGTSVFNMIGGPGKCVVQQ